MKTCMKIICFLREMRNDASKAIFLNIDVLAEMKSLVARSQLEVRSVLLLKLKVPRIYFIIKVALCFIPQKFLAGRIIKYFPSIMSTE